MALVVGTDSYVTLEEAEDYIKRYPSNSKQFINWCEASERDKEAYLLSSCQSIDFLRFSGSKLNYSQTLQFPRKNSRVAGYGFRLYVGQLYDNGLIEGNSNNNGLTEVKQAQIENAINHLVIGVSIVNEQLSRSIRGLTAKKAGSISESYDTKSKTTKDAINGIYTSKVYEILKSWINSARFGI